MKITPQKEISDLVKGLFKEDCTLESLFDCSTMASGLILRFGSLAYMVAMADKMGWVDLGLYENLNINLEEIKNAFKSEAGLFGSYLSGCFLSYVVNKDTQPKLYQNIRFAFNSVEYMAREGLRILGKLCLDYYNKKLRKNKTED